LNFSPTDEQLMLRGLVERFVTDRYDQKRRADYRRSASGYSAENWATLAQLGLLELPLSGEPGTPDGVVELIILMESLGRGHVIEPILEEIVIAGGLMAAAGSAAQRAQWLPAITQGQAHFALAHFELDARFDLGSVKTTAKFQGKGYALEGEKSVVLAGAGADHFLVSARSHDTGEVGFYLLDAQLPGLRRTALPLIDGSQAIALSLNGSLAAQRLEGGLNALVEVVDRARVAACAEMIGVMSRIFDSTLDYVRNRKQFGVPLGTFQVVQHRLADLYVSLEQCRSHLYRAALWQGTRTERERTIAGAKSYVSNAAVSLGEQCIQLHGGMGISDEMTIGHGHKRALVLATLFGDADFDLRRFARAAA
jgi:alkylation response protein AidB-like acyl-CoA dehydrogenase